MSWTCRSLVATALTLLLTACHGWDKPLYQENPTSGNFAVGTWINEKKEIIRIFEKDKNYYGIILGNDGAVFIPFTVTRHNDMTLLIYDFALIRTLPVQNNSDQAKTEDHHLYQAFSVKAAEQGLTLSAIDEMSLSKILEDAGVTSTADVCRSLAERPKEAPAKKPSLLERCSVINTEFVERMLRDKDLPLDKDHPVVLTPLAY